RHRARHLAHRRIRPTPGRLHPPGRVHPATPRRRPRRELRGRRDPPRGWRATPPRTALTRHGFQLLSKVTYMRQGHWNRRGGRDVLNLLADFGHPLPARTPDAPKTVDPRLFTQLISRRGRIGKATGWAAALAPLSVWRMTSEQTPVFWPLIAANGLPPT